MTAPYVLFDDQISGVVRAYHRPLDIIEAWEADDVAPAFGALQRYHAQGRHLAGYFSYELGYLLEPRLEKNLPTERTGPLLQFGVFSDLECEAFGSGDLPALPDLRLSPSWTADDYLERFEKVLAYIHAGDVYQINLTFPMTGHYAGTAKNLYNALRRRQPGRYGGVVSLGGAEIVSLSPELFFQKTGSQMDMRPMKGTVRRQADPVQDAAAREEMRTDAKSQAENLMIVDLLRNDLSRLASVGSVNVPELFALETYPTLHQMTSQVRASLRPSVSFTDIFKNLFPCGSVTGAPKIRAMEIIHELESVPRGAYCGSLGYIDPSGDACFNVAIRTLTVQNSKVTYNVGSGVVLDSDGMAEYAECFLKAKVVMGSSPDLLETMRWVPGAGILRQDRHLGRLGRSAKALGYFYSKDKVLQALSKIDMTSPQRVRLALSLDGDIRVDQADFQSILSKWKVSLSANPLTPDVQETRHKVNARDFYDGERVRVQKLTGCDEVLFFNSDYQLCEGSFTSVFIQVDGKLLTPKLSCGLLPGVLREEMIGRGEAVEVVLSIDDIKKAERIYVGNSLRGLIRVELMDYSRH